MIITNMLNYRLIKHTNQLISYYTREINLYNYTHILGTSSINTTCQQLVKRLATTCLQVVYNLGVFMPVKRS